MFEFYINVAEIIAQHKADEITTQQMIEAIRHEVDFIERTFVKSEDKG